LEGHPTLVTLMHCRSRFRGTLRLPLGPCLRRPNV
jgi:hypothetical protein